MSNDVSKVYQFLSTIGDWKTKADKDGDGTIIKSEFRNFMLDDYEWDGETTDAGKNDLINTFWKSIDTNQSGKISGTRFKNKNALDSKEIENVQYKLEVYQAFDSYKSSEITTPTGVDANAWQSSVAESLSAKVEEYIKTKGSADGLKEYLDGFKNDIMNRTTANETAKSYLKELVPNYNNGQLDNTLNNIITNYITKKINNNDTKADKLDITTVQADIKDIVNAYVATSSGEGIDEKAKELLKEYGYTISDSTKLNDLQKSIVKTKLTEALADLKNEADYKNNSALYDTAINEYIESILSEKTFGDYANKNIEYSVQAFKDSETGKALTKTIEVKNLFNSDELKTAITNKLSSSFADRISGLMKGEISAYDDIQAQALEKVKNGDFDTDGTLDTQKAIEWVVEQMTQRLTEFYPNGLNDMSLTNLGVMYDKLVESAKANDDADSVKKAAQSYCDAIAKKSTKLAEAVKDVFGSSYSTEINKLTTPEIETKMTELKAKVEEIGDPSSFEVKDWGSLPSEVSLAINGSKSYKLESTIWNGASNIATDRISYGYNVKSGNAKVSISNSGALTITAGNTTDASTIEIYAMVDEAKVEPAITMKVTTNKTSFDWSNMNAKYNGYIANGDNGYTPNTVKTLGELYNNNGVINLLPSEGLLRGTDWKNAVGTAKSNIKSFVEMLSNNCMSTGEYNQQALNTAKQKVTALYETAFTHSLDNWAGKKSTRDNLVEYDGENYGYQVAKYWSNASTQNTDYSASCSASDNKLGLRISEQYDDGWFQITVNVKCVMDLFNKFYEQALTA